MNVTNNFSEEGWLELYALGALDPGETAAAEALIQSDPALQLELTNIQETMAEFATLHAIAPPAGFKAKIMQAWDDHVIEMAHINPERPPLLSKHSTGKEYAFWLNREGMAPPAEFQDLFFIPVAMNEEALTAIVWINGHVEEEMHEDSIEQFLVLEGSCVINIEGNEHHLKAGDYLSVPTLLWHTVDVTSDITCKLIVQRVAA